jgi:hypothetical protein
VWFERAWSVERVIISALLYGSFSSIILLPLNQEGCSGFVALEWVDFGSILAVTALVEERQRHGEMMLFDCLLMRHQREARSCFCSVGEARTTDGERICSLFFLSWGRGPSLVGSRFAFSASVLRRVHPAISSLAQSCNLVALFLTPSLSSITMAATNGLAYEYTTTMTIMTTSSPRLAVLLIISQYFVPVLGGCQRASGVDGDLLATSQS